MPEEERPVAGPDDLRRVAVLSDLRTPWCLRVAATLRIADHIAAGVSDIGSLAGAAACDSGFLSRVLRHLVSEGVFCEPAPGRFALNGPARALLDPSLRLVLDLEGFGGRLAHAWSTLPSVVRTGRSAYHELFGLSFWEDMDAHPDIAASVESHMTPRGRRDALDAEVLLDGDWDSVRSVVDVGGGTGALLAEILRARPALRGTLVDLPQTVARSEVVFRDAGVEERAATIGQSFLDPLPAGADLYLLRNVLAVCPDHTAEELLSRCAEAARPHGRVTVLGGVSPDPVAAGVTPEMVLMGGKERTLAEFQDLARTAGLEVRASGRRRSGQFAVECLPA